MTKKNLIRKILELGKELEEANGFDAVMIINDMEIEVDKYIKQLPIHNVVVPKGTLCVCKSDHEFMITNGDSYLCCSCRKPIA